MGKANAHRNVMAGRAGLGTIPPANAHRLTPADDTRDFYPTPPWGARAGAEIIRTLLDPRAVSAAEVACGAGHMVHGLKDYFATVHASDAYAYDGNRIFDYLGQDPLWCGQPDWVVTNPPFAHAEAFIRRAWRDAGRGVAILGRVALLETIGRHSLLYADVPLTVVAPFSERLPMTKDRWDPDKSSAAFYAWFFFLKPALRPQRFMARIGGRYLPATLDIPPGTEARLTAANDAALFGVTDREAAA
jgi:hypothetical protein